MIEIHDVPEGEPLPPLDREMLERSREAIKKGERGKPVDELIAELIEELSRPGVSRKSLSSDGTSPNI